MKRRGFLLLLASLTLGGMSSLSSCKAPENEYNDKSFAYVNLDYDATLMDVKIKDAKEKYYSGDIISLEITPKDGYVFAYGLINGEVIKDITNISLPSGNTTIKLFAKLLIDNDGITNIRDFTFTQSADKKSYILSSYVPSGKMPEVCEIPDTYEDKPITEIADAAFTSASGIKGIKIGKNIEKINSKAFTNCITLTDYSVSEGNEHFSASSGALFTKDGSTLLFYAPQHAGEFTIPSGTKTISPYAFSLATGLTKINFNDDLEEIGEYAFNYCGNLIELNIPSSVKKIGNYAFNTCSLLKSVTLNEGLTSIGEYAFYKDIKLEKVNIPGSLKEVSQGAFSSCESLTNLSFAE